MKIEEVERFDRQRDASILLQLIGFGVWWGVYLLLLDSGWHPTGLGRLLLIVLCFIGWATWFGGLVWLLRWGWALRGKRELVEALNDEGIMRNRLRALRTSFWCTLICLVIGRTLATVVTLPAGLVLDVLIWVLVVSQLGAYLWFNRE